MARPPPLAYYSAGTIGLTAMLTLANAIKTGRLREFIEQEEARGVTPASLREFENLAADLIKDTPQKGQTSRSPARGGPSGK